MTDAAGLRASWSRLVAVLEERAPRTTAEIQPPAADHQAAVAAVESRLGIPLTDEVRAWFALHDGGENALLFPGAGLASLEDVVRDTEMIRQVWTFPSEWAEDPVAALRAPAGTGVGTWSPFYLRIGCDVSGCGYFLDLRDGPLRGCVRRWDDVGADIDDANGAPSLTALLDMVLTSLTTGARIGYWQAEIVDGYLDWTIPA